MGTILLALAACTSECGGPACEDAWPASRLLLADAGDLGRTTSVLQLEDRIEGGLTDGADWAVAAHDGRLYVGMPERSAVAVYAVPVGTLDAEAALLDRIELPSAEQLGTSLTLLDTDGDGRTELWVGAPGHEGDTGAVYRFPDASILDTWDLRITGGTPGDRYGEALTRCADLTGDGHPELAVFAPWFATPALTEWPSAIPNVAGSVWLVRSDDAVGPGGAAWEHGPVWWGGAAGDRAGRAVMCSHDLTGDGEPDLLIGSPMAGDDDSGRLFLRSGDALATGGPLSADDPHAITPEDAMAGWFGQTLAVRSDPEGADLLVGAPGWSTGRGRVGALSLPIEPGVFTAEAWFTNPREEPDHFGDALAIGDLEGNGFEDLLVGATDWRQQRGQGDARTRYDTGHAWIWAGANRFRWDRYLDTNLAAEHELRGSQPFLRIGRGARFADLDGDGADTLLQAVRAPEP